MSSNLEYKDQKTETMPQLDQNSSKISRKNSGINGNSRNNID